MVDRVMGADRAGGLVVEGPGLREGRSGRDAARWRWRRHPAAAPGDRQAGVGDTEAIVRVLLCDANELYRAGIRTVLDRCPDIEVVGEAYDGEHAVAIARHSRPDVALIDYELPTAGAVDVLPDIAAFASIVAVTCSLVDDRAVAEVLRLGARGYLRKDLPATRFVACVGLLSHGQVIVPASAGLELVETADGDGRGMGAAAGRTAPEAATCGTVPLTRRQRDVLGLVAFGLSNTEIARKLYVSEATVKSHVSAMLRRLDLRDRAQLVAYAYRTAGLWGAEMVSTPPPEPG